MPALGFLVLGAHGIVEISDRALVHLRIIRFDVHLRERNSQQRRGGREPNGVLIRLDCFGDAAILEQHLPLELAIIGVVRIIPDQPIDDR